MRGTSRLTGVAVYARPVSFGVTAVLLVAAAAVFVAVLMGAQARGEVGYDAGLYIDSAARWLATGEFYYPIQFAGPYPSLGTVMLYPPVSLYLFAPFVWLPRILWWAIPLGVLVWHMWSCRPSWWTWPVIAACLATVPSAAILVYGNTDLWSVAILSLAFRWPVASWALAFKPSVLPLAAFFVRDDGLWWKGGVVLLVAAVPFGALWFDWVAALRNLESRGLLYSLNSLPWLAIPVVAWWGRLPREQTASGR